MTKEKKTRTKAATAKGPKPAKKVWAYMIGQEGPYGIDHAMAHAKAHKKDITNAKHLKALFMSKVEAKPGEKCKATGTALIPGEADGPAPTATPHINRKRFDKMLRVGLEGEEREVAFIELKVARKDLADQTTSWEAVKSEWKETIKLAEARVEEAFHTLEQGANVITPVEEVKNHGAGIYQLIRIADGKVLEERPMTPEDGQPELNGLDAESPASAQPYDASDAIDGSKGPKGADEPNPNGFELDEDVDGTKH